MERGAYPRTGSNAAVRGRTNNHHNYRNHKINRKQPHRGMVDTVSVSRLFHRHYSLLARRLITKSTDMCNYYQKLTYCIASIRCPPLIHRTNVFCQIRERGILPPAFLLMGGLACLQGYQSPNGSIWLLQPPVEHCCRPQG